MGMSYSQIATELGYSDAAGAQYAVIAAIDKVMREPVEKVVDLELQRLDGMLQAVLPRALANPPDLGAVDRVLALMSRRARFLGLDAPVKVASTDPEGKAVSQPNLAALSIEELIRLKELVEKAETGKEQ